MLFSSVGTLILVCLGRSMLHVLYYIYDFKVSNYASKVNLVESAIAPLVMYRSTGRSSPFYYINSIAFSWYQVLRGIVYWCCREKTTVRFKRQHTVTLVRSLRYLQPTGAVDVREHLR